jgi:hypothetical protein
MYRDQKFLSDMTTYCEQFRNSEKGKFLEEAGVPSYTINAFAREYALIVIEEKATKRNLSA